MKKLFKVVIVFTLILSLFSLTGCGGKEQTATFKKSTSNGVELTISFHAKGDTVDKMTQVTKIDISKYSKEQVDTLYNQGDKAKQQFSTIDGLNYNLKEENDVMIETIEISFTKDNIKQLSDSNILPMTESNVSKISLEKTIEQFENQGYERVE